MVVDALWLVEFVFVIVRKRVRFRLLQEHFSTCYSVELRAGRRVLPIRIQGLVCPVKPDSRSRKDHHFGLFIFCNFVVCFVPCGPWTTVKREMPNSH